MPQQKVGCKISKIVPKVTILGPYTITNLNLAVRMIHRVIAPLTVKVLTSAPLTG